MELGSFLTLLFGFLTIVGILGAVYGDVDNDTDKFTVALPSGIAFMEDFIAPFGEWVTWLAAIGPIGFVVCVWWLYDYRKKTKKLMQLIDTPSKAKFVRNLDDIEYLAWSLPMRYEQKVLIKKREFKL